MIELLSNAEMGEADRMTIAGGLAGMVLMENAGRAVADCAAARHPPGSRVTVVAGPGNNGGDGFVAARLLAERGYRVAVLLVGERDRLKGDAGLAAARWSGPVEAVSAERLASAHVIVDALFGAGLDRPVEGLARQAIAAINAAGVPVIAVDLASGVNGSTGAVMGIAVRAERSVTFFRRKPGHLLLPGRLHCGTVQVADIGIPASVLAEIGPKTFANVPPLWRVPVPRHGGHKYIRGHAVVVSGGMSTTGAARLSARGALRAGAGLVTIASPRDALLVNAATNLAIMVRPVDGADALTDFLADRRLNAVALGPGSGVGQRTRDMALAALAGERGVVLDADALTSFAEDPGPLIDACKGRAAATVLTPHQGEFARLLQNWPQIIDLPSKLDQARTAAPVLHAVVLLKGSDTVIADPDGRAAITANAPPWLATAGSGDVLTGIIAGLIAQGMPGFEAAAAGAWLHGEAGTEAGPGLIAEDLPDVLPRVLRTAFA